MNCFIVDDHPMMRQGLMVALEQMPNCQVVGEAGSVDEALNKLQNQSVDVVILDHKLHDLTGLDLIGRLSKSHSNIRYIVVTQFEEKAILHSYRDRGVSAILSKLSANEDLARALDAVEKNDIFISSSVQHLLSQSGGDSVLTSRETEVVRLVSLGKTNKEVATLLDCSVETIKSHKSNIMKKLKFNNSVEITVWAMKQGLI